VNCDVTKRFSYANFVLVWNLSPVFDLVLHNDPEKNRAPPPTGPGDGIQKKYNTVPDPCIDKPLNRTYICAMIEITAPVYRLIANRLSEAIATAEWFNGTIEFSAAELLPPAGEVAENPASNPAAAPAPFEARLTLSAIIYRRPEVLPEGSARPISDVVPVWWEFSTVGVDGAEVNDFSFSELKPWLTDPD
jgi:hypothetical protein